jgi:hypothetical protein
LFFAIVVEVQGAVPARIPIGKFFTELGYMPTPKNVFVRNPSPNRDVSGSLVDSIKNFIRYSYQAKAGAVMRGENAASTFHVSVRESPFGVDLVSVIKVWWQSVVIRGVDVVLAAIVVSDI